MANKSVLTITYKLLKEGKADKEVLDGLKSVQKGVGTAMAAFAAFAGVAYTVDKALDATVGTFVNYAAQVREMNRLTGAGSEETSRLIQMADDLTISYESLQKSLWFASKNGVEVNVESLAQLADQYVALNSPMAQAEFLAKNFGKSGAEMAKMLEQGGDAVKEWAQSIEGSLVLTDQAIQQAREYELATDELNDSWQAFKITIGQQVVPALNEILFGLNNQTEIQDEANRLIEEGIAKNREQALTMAVQNIKYQEGAVAATDHGAALDGDTQSILANADALAAQSLAIDEMSQRNTDMLSGILNLQSINDDYQESLTTLTDKMTALKDEQAKYTEGGSKWKDIQGDIDATGAAIDQLAADYEMSTKRIIFSMVQQQAASDGLTDAEMANLLAIGVQMGILDQETVTTFQNMQTQATALANGGLADTRHEMKQIIDKAEKLGEISGAAFDFFVNIHTSGSFPGITKTVTTRKQTETATALAGGGQWGGGWAVVGEEGFEILSPSGYVFPHEQAKQMIAGGLIPDMQLAGGGSLKMNALAGEDFTPSTPTLPGGGGGGGGTTVKKRRDRGELSGGNSAAVTSAVVSEAVTPLVETTANAAQSTQAAQQATAAEMQATRNAIEQGNALQAELIDEIRRFNATNKQTIMAAFEQSRG